jgi:hypothetical protein
LYIALIAIGVGAASDMITITLAGNVLVTGNLDVEGPITGQTIIDLESRKNILEGGS